MRKLYGDSLRSDAGFVKVIKKVAKKNADLLESRAGRHAPEIKRVAKEVKGTFDKVYEETAEVLEELLAKCVSHQNHVLPLSAFCPSSFPLYRTARPKISEVVQDTKVLLQQSRERLVISWVSSIIILLFSRFHSDPHVVSLRRVVNDLSSYDPSKYHISVIPSTRDESLRFHLGEPIRVKWQAPPHHSRRDWIGIYRVCFDPIDP